MAGRDSLKRIDVLSAKIFVSVAIGIDDDIVMNWDAPSVNGLGKMLVLDTQIYVVEREKEVKIHFYEKRDSVWSQRQLLRSLWQSSTGRS